MYYLCEKYLKPVIVQDDIVDYISWVPSLILLDLRTDSTYKWALRTELIQKKGTSLYLLQKHPCWSQPLGLTASCPNTHMHMY